MSEHNPHVREHDYNLNRHRVPNGSHKCTAPSSGQISNGFSKDCSDSIKSTHFCSFHSAVRCITQDSVSTPYVSIRDTICRRRQTHSDSLNHVNRQNDTHSADMLTLERADGFVNPVFHSVVNLSSLIPVRRRLPVSTHIPNVPPRTSVT